MVTDSSAPKDPMTKTKIGIPQEAVISLDGFLAEPLQNRARTMARITGTALRLIEAANTHVQWRDENKLSVSEKAIRILEKGEFAGSFTLCHTPHANDKKGQWSLAPFEEQVHEIEEAIREFTSDAEGMISSMEEIRSERNCRYTVFPDVNVVFRDRTLATMMYKGIVTKLAKRTTAVYDIDKFPGDIAPKPLRRSPDPLMATRRPGETSDDPVSKILDWVEPDKQILTYANVLGVVLPKFISTKDTRQYLGNIPMFEHYDVQEHATSPQRALDFLNTGMVIAPRHEDPKLRKVPGLHVVDSTVYISALC